MPFRIQFFELEGPRRRGLKDVAAFCVIVLLHKDLKEPRLNAGLRDRR